MKNIGKRIKELRIKNGQTQEKLADRLGVSFQSVSKWETGVTMPDISMLVPLARILNVSTDELLGVSKSNERRKELECVLEKAWKEHGERDNYEAVYEAEKTLALEFPDDMKLLFNFALSTHNRSYTAEDRTEKMNEAIELYEKVIENTDDQILKTNAIYHLTLALAEANSRDKAKKYIDMLPDENRYPSKNIIIENILEGDEFRKHRQERLICSLENIIDILPSCTEDKLKALDLCEKLAELFFPDGNILQLSYNLSMVARHHSSIYLNKKEYDKALEYLKKYKEYSVIYDNLDHSSVNIPYTSPYFDLLSTPSCENPVRVSDPSYITLLECFKSYAECGCWDVIRETKEFQELIK